MVLDKHIQSSCSLKKIKKAFEWSLFKRNCLRMNLKSYISMVNMQKRWSKTLRLLAPYFYMLHAFAASTFTNLYTFIASLVLAYSRRRKQTAMDSSALRVMVSTYCSIDAGKCDLRRFLVPKRWGGEVDGLYIDCKTVVFHLQFVLI